MAKETYGYCVFSKVHPACCEAQMPIFWNKRVATKWNDEHMNGSGIVCRILIQQVEPKTRKGRE